MGEVATLEVRLVTVINQILARDDMQRVSLDLVDGVSAKAHTPPPVGKTRANGTPGMVTTAMMTSNLDEKIANCTALAQTISYLLTQITQV